MAQKGFIGILIVLIGLTLSGLAVFFFYPRQDHPVPAETLKTNHPLELSQSASASAKPLANSFESYFDELYKFSVSFPSSWTIKESEDRLNNKQIELSKDNSIIYLAVVSPWSTSNAVCAGVDNKPCVAAEKIDLIIAKKTKKIDIFNLDNQSRMQFELPNKRVQPQGSKGLNAILSVFASFEAKDRGVVIAILTSINY